MAAEFLKIWVPEGSGLRLNPGSKLVSKVKDSESYSEVVLQCRDFSIGILNEGDDFVTCMTECWRARQ